MNKVAIVDYGMCNLDSVRRAFEELGADAFVTDDPAGLERADRIVLPGVGAFPDAMRNLRTRGFDDALAKQVLDGGAPFLGVCLGMQLLATRGDEGIGADGLGLIPGVVTRIDPGEGLRVPHVGWNEVQVRRSSPLFDGLEDGRDFYFVHSYELVPDDDEDTVAVTPYGTPLVAAVDERKVYGVQFHPEKSQHFGAQLLRNFAVM